MYKTEDHSDMALFKNRLWKLMSDRGIVSADELARNLCKLNLVSVKTKLDADECIDDNERLRLSVASVTKKIQDHLKSGDANKL